MSEHSNDSHGAIVIGAGPAGVAVAATLGARGVETVVLERGDAVGTSWREHYDGLRLNSMRIYSKLPGLPIPRRYGRFVSRDDFLAYLEAYEALNRLDVRYGCEVHRIDRDPGGTWCVAASAGTLHARVVVVATGFDARATLPEWATTDGFAGEVLHSSALRALSPYRDRDVLVVGAANSGFDVAGLLIRAGARVSLSMRSAPNIFPREWRGFPLQPLGILGEHLPITMTDRSGLAMQRRIYGDLTPYGLPPAATGMRATFRDRRRNPAVDDGFVAALKEGRTRVVGTVAHLDGTDAVLSDGSRIPCDVVICATGFARALEALVGHLGVLGSDGVPRYERAVPANPDTPGLYFAGFDATPTGQIRTIGIQARRIARDATNRRGESSSASRTRPAWTERSLRR